MSNLINKMLSILLLVSLALNAWFWSIINQEPNSEQLTSKQTNSAVTSNKSNSEPPFSDDKLALTKLIALAEQEFEQKKFSEATDIFNDIKHLDEHSANELLSTWRNSVNTWLSQKSFSQAQQFIESFLHYYPFDFTVLELEAQYLELTLQLPEAIKTYQVLIDNSLQQVLIDSWQQQIQQLADAHTQQLTKNELWLQLADFMDQMIYHDSENLSYQFTKAQALFNLAKYSDSKDYLLSLRQDPNFKVKSENLLKLIAKLMTGSKQIPLTRSGAHYLVSGTVNNHSELNLLIDTGATLSTISRQAFNRLENWHQPTYLRNANFRTAGGVVDAAIYRFERFEVNGFAVEPFELVVMDLDKFDHADGLLGMNFLSHFDFQIDQQVHALFMEHRN